MSWLIRKARLNDVEKIHALVNKFAARGQMLAVPRSELYDNVRDFTISSESEGADERLVACCSLRIFWADLAEIRALAVAEEAQGRGIGKDLVMACLEEARVLGVARVFALTYLPDFFGKLGFRLVDKNDLPHKVWVDCLRCPKFPDCDEVAVALDF